MVAWPLGGRLRAPRPRAGLPFRRPRHLSCRPSGSAAEASFDGRTSGTARRGPFASTQARGERDGNRRPPGCRWVRGANRMDRPTRNEIIGLCASAPEQVADLVLALYQPVDVLQQQSQSLKARVRELERRLGQDSSNSRKPPASDGYGKQAPKSLGGHRGPPSGGQPGHPGHRLECREKPDQVVVHRPGVCRGCGGCLVDESPGGAVDRRQAFELVARVEVTEHQVHEVRCACCDEATGGAFLPTVASPRPGAGRG